MMAHSAQGRKCVRCGKLSFATYLFWCILASVAITTSVHGQIPLEGFIPLVGLSLTDEFADSNGQNATFFLAEARNSVGGTQLSAAGQPAFYDVALLDTGAATHILTAEAHIGFDIDGNEFDGTNVQTVGGATGFVDLEVNDPLGVYVAGLDSRTSTANGLQLDPADLKGQISVSTLSADTSWKLPNVVGLPMAAQHAVHIKNSEPQIFELNGRTVRTPQIDFKTLGSGGQGILRRTQMNLNPGSAFSQGIPYVFDFGGIGSGDPLHENPSAPSVVQGGLFIDTNLDNGTKSLETGLFFDTGASLTVLSTETAVRLGIDPILDTPDFELSVEGSGGVDAGIPGFFIDELSLITAGGSFAVQNVPIAILDITDVSNPGSIVPGILGMNVFADRDLVIDAVPSLGGGGNPPALYISDSVTQTCNWTSTAASGAWSTNANWSNTAGPNVQCDAQVSNPSGNAQAAVVSANSTVYRATISGTPSAEMVVRITSGAKLTTYAEIDVSPGGRLHLETNAGSPSKIDAQYIQISGGTFSGSGDIFVGAGPVNGALRNVNGLVAPGELDAADGSVIGHISIVGDFDNQGILEIDLGGTSTGEYDSINADRNVYLKGTLNVNLVDLGSGLFQPQAGNTFEILTADDGISGTFDTLSLPTLPTGFTWNVNYNTDSVELRVAAAGLTCDVDTDGDCQIDDLDGLYAAFGSSGGKLDYDLSGTVDEGDIAGWLASASDPLNPGKLNSADIYKVGDTNLDGNINSTDLGQLLNNFGSVTKPGWSGGDLTGDGNVNSTDLGKLLNHFNHTSAAAAAVPEPSSVSLMLLGLILAMRSLRRR